MAVDPIEEWLGTRLKAAYPVDDWVLEGVTSALLLMEDRADAVDTIANFLGTADAPGTNEQIVDELFRRKRGDATGAGAGGNQSRASEPAPSSAGPSRDASSARARATSSSDAHEARVDVAERKKKSGGERRDGVSAKTTPSSPPTTKKKDTPRRPVRPEELAKKDINCLGCGKIYRCAPRDGALSADARAFLERGCVCVFCGDAVVVALADGAEMALPPDETPKNKTDASASSRSHSRKTSVSGSRPAEVFRDADAAARDAKDRLVEFDRTAAARTTVIDDQSDWFEIESNAWLDEDEREEAKAQARELEEAREAAKRDRSTRVTLDLLGRRVDDAETRGDSENAGSGFVLRTNSVEDNMDTMVGTRATKHRPLSDEPSNARAVGGAGAAAVLTERGSTATRDLSLFRVGANPTAGFAPAFSGKDKSATKKKGKKGPFTDAERETNASVSVAERGARNKRVQDESPFDVVARETEKARRDEN